ncbi:MAG TPA: ATP-binding cassette domain-containing protein [Clostridiales bacterium]|nr:ATP-binding cassette domain-containing protein [Clostridiales bacterium]
MVLKAENLTGSVMIENISFELHRGEILGIGSLSGGGIHELGRLLFGIDKAIVGSVKLADGTEINSPSVAVKNKIGYVSKNRDEEAIMLQASIKNNIAISSLSELVKHGIIANKRERKLAEDTCRDMEVKCAGIEQQINNLSGGNKQKVSFGKWAGADAQILILDCLTTNQERLREARDIRKHIALVTSYISEANKEASYQS